jgi:glucoamylase
MIKKELVAGGVLLAGLAAAGGYGVLGSRSASGPQVAVSALSAVMGTAPGAPGADSVWAPAQKSFLGTAKGGASRVYFTGYRGIVSEVFYPVLDTVETVDLQFLVGDAAQTYVDEEKLQQYAATRPNPRSLRWQVVTSNAAHGWRLTKQVFTDPARDALVERVTFDALPGHTLGDFRLYVLHNPALDNSGAGDSSHRVAVGATSQTMLVASQNARASALAVSRPWVVDGSQPMVSSGFVGSSDGWTDLLGGPADKAMSWAYDSAQNGNVAQMGWIDLGAAGAASTSFDLVLAFGAGEASATSTAAEVLGSDLAAAQASYDAGWQAYTNGLDAQGGSADDQYYLAAMSLAAISDKSNGAMIAGMGTPWGETAKDGNDGGYHLVWARDLFKFANALLTAGDLSTATGAVQYLFNTLQQSSDCSNGSPDCPRGGSRVGRFPQNAWVSGYPYWPGTQLDEQAMPTLLAWRVYERGDSATQAQMNALWPKFRASADYILEIGPWTQQERWEENSGYSPSTIAAAVAGLVAAARFALLNGDGTRAGNYLEAADHWQQNVTGWTFASEGFLGNGHYYERINPAARGNTGNGLERFHPATGPDADVDIAIGNGGGSHKARDVIDGGFLELVRLGLKAADDPSILETLPEYDATLKRSIPGKGDAYFRYNYDGYGERNDGHNYGENDDTTHGRGRLWPIFSAERGMYEIARTGNAGAGTPFVAALKQFSTPEGFLPEQVWNDSVTLPGSWQVTTPSPYVPGTPTKSIAPLNWAMGEYISLIASIHAGRIVDVPVIVCSRYQTCAPPAPAGQIALNVAVTANTSPGQHVYVTGSVPELGSWDPKLGIPTDPASYPTWKARVVLPAGAAIQYKYYRKNRDGSPQWESRPGGGNRSLTTPASGTTTLADTVVW